MQRTVKNAIISILISSLVLLGCRKEKAYWEDDFVAPLAQGNLSLGNMFPDTTIKSNPDSSLKIAFESVVINYGIDSLLKMPDTTISTISTNTLVSNYPFTPGTLLFNSSSTTYYNFPNGILLTYAKIRNGKVKVEFSNTVRQPLSYHYKLLSGQKNNQVLDTTFEIPGAVYSGTTLVTAGTNSCYINLSGYDIDFTGTNHNVNNTIDQYGDISISNLAQPDTLYLNQGLIANFTFTGIVPQYAQGYFGNQVVTVGPDTSIFNVFNTIQSGMLNLNSATVKLKIVNEFGADMRATIGNITAISTANQQTVTINGSNSTPLISPLNLNAAINTGSGAIASTKTLTLNSANTPNLTNFIGILPDKFAYKLTTQLNPNGNLGGTNDFAYYGTGFKAYLDADIPLYFQASNLKLADTVPLNMSTVNQFKNINHGQLVLTATNSYPFTINLQGYLLDEHKNIMDVLFDAPNTVQAPMLDANLKVIAPLQSKLIAPLNASKISNLKRAKYIYYSATFNTASQPDQIKFYDHYTLGLLLTADINYTVGK